MLDVRIRQCRLRVIRHGGWSWGVDRQRLIDLASDRLPTLIAELLEQLPPTTQADVHIKKLNLRLRGRTNILSAEAFSAGPIVTEHWRSSLAQQLREQIAAESPALLLKQPDQQPGPEASPAPAAKAPSNVEQLLALWRSQGSLAHHLRRFSQQALTLWEQTWLRIRQRRTLQPEAAPERLAKQADALLRILPRYGDDLRGLRQARLHLLVELDFHSAGSLGSDVAKAELDRCLPLVVQARDEPGSEGCGEATARDETEQTPVPRSKTTADPYPQRSEVPSPLTPLYTANDIDTHVASALPYLVLGTLHHLGYLQAAYATLESGATLAQAHCLSSALAIKLLPTDMEMDHQARRHVITTFSLMEQPPAPQAYAGFESAIGSALSAADAGIYAGLLAGHQASTSLLIQNRNPGWMLFDTQGMFPLAVAAGTEELKALLEPYSKPIVMLPRDVLSQPLLETIVAAGGSFLTDAVPARGAPWIAVDRARRFHTHREHPVARSLIRRFDACTTAAMTLLERHLSARRLLPERRLAALDVSTELAAGAGLADLAYLLWGEREASHPLLAYQRLHDLEARVRVDAERVRVSLALGQRYFDLREKGLLRDLADVPWFGGRTLIFNGL